MNLPRMHVLTHFGPLFLTALGGWVAFNLVNSGTAQMVPGVIVAGLLAYGGTLFASRIRTLADLRTTYSLAQTTQRFPTIPAAAPRGATFGSPRYRPLRDDMDIAAGD